MSEGTTPIERRLRVRLTIFDHQGEQRDYWLRPEPAEAGERRVTLHKFGVPPASAEKAETYVCHLFTDGRTSCTCPHGRHKPDDKPTGTFAADSDRRCKHLDALIRIGSFDLAGVCAAWKLAKDLRTAAAKLAELRRDINTPVRPVVCQRCEGRRMIRTHSDSYECPDCQGRGFEINQDPVQLPRHPAPFQPGQRVAAHLAAGEVVGTVHRTTRTTVHIEPDNGNRLLKVPRRRVSAVPADSARAA